MLNLWIVLGGTFLFFGSMLTYGLVSARRDHRLARDEDQAAEWQHLPIDQLDQLDQKDFRLWRVLHIDKGIATNLTIEDENRIAQAQWSRRSIQSDGQSDRLSLEFFPQMVGSGFVGSVDGQYNDSLVIKSAGHVIAEAVPQVRTPFGGFDILMDDGPWTLEWFDRRRQLIAPGGLSGRILHKDQVVAVFAFDLDHPKSFKRIIAFQNNLSLTQKLCLTIPILTGNYRGISFSEPAKIRGAEVPVINRNTVAANVSGKPNATLRERFGPLLFLGCVFPPLFALLFTDLIFMSAHSYINPFSFVLLHIWPASVICGLSVGYLSFRSLKNSGGSTREAMTYFSALITIPIVSASIYILNSQYADGKTVEVIGFVVPGKIPLYTSKGRFLGLRTQVSFPETTVLGQEINSKRLLSPHEEREQVASGTNEVKFRVHEGRFGMNWFE